jgi:hypothetical protein
MRKKPDTRALLYERIQNSPPKFVHVTGVPYSMELKPPAEGGTSDQVWITMEAPPYGRVRAVINTVSRLNELAGVKPDVRLGLQTVPWEEKPETGLTEASTMSYGAVEATLPMEYTDCDPASLGTMLLERARSAVRMEVWGDLYASDHLGVRQIHSRRASATVKEDLSGRDGALRLYYPDNRSEIFLFKFHGQP